MAILAHQAALALAPADLVVPGLALVSRVAPADPEVPGLVQVSRVAPEAPVSLEARDPALAPVDLVVRVDLAAQALRRDARPAISRLNRAAADFPSWRSIPAPLPDAGSGMCTFGRATVMNIGPI